MAVYSPLLEGNFCPEEAKSPLGLQPQPWLRPSVSGPGYRSTLHLTAMLEGLYPLDFSEFGNPRLQEFVLQFDIRPIERLLFLAINERD